MKENLPWGGKVMSRMPQEAFYAEMKLHVIPHGNYENILRVARSSKVQYLVIDEKIDELSPGFYKMIREKDMVLLKEFRGKKEWILIFRIIYPE